jgi:hemerythrin-like domain-containing protein
MTAPDLSIYYMVHRAMKGDAARLARAVAEVEPGDHHRAVVFERWYEGYVGELHDHHTIEDDIFFPALVEKVPVFADQVPRIDRDHARLDELLDWTKASLRDLAGGPGSWDAAQGDASRATAELAALLDDHLGFEDADVLPLFTRHFTAEDYDELDRSATAKPNLRQLLFTIPWALDWATDAERTHTFDKTPFVFKLIWQLRRRPYARLADKTFAGIPKPDADKLTTEVA